MPQRACGDTWVPWPLQPCPSHTPGGLGTQQGMEILPQGPEASKVSEVRVPVTSWAWVCAQMLGDGLQSRPLPEPGAGAGGSSQLFLKELRGRVGALLRPGLHSPPLLLPFRTHGPTLCLHAGPPSPSPRRGISGLQTFHQVELSRCAFSGRGGTMSKGEPPPHRRRL